MERLEKEREVSLVWVLLLFGGLRRTGGTQRLRRLFRFRRFSDHFRFCLFRGRLAGFGLIGWNVPGSLYVAIRSRWRQYGRLVLHAPPPSAHQRCGDQQEQDQYPSAAGWRLLVQRKRKRHRWGYWKRRRRPRWGNHSNRRDHSNKPHHPNRRE